ncbi:MAG: hypothetical protein AB202_01470 [Parcubacteria bacterium C7867-007]|nr:MAG: hypothetical protein AB202_01470 [Parcubacteria bacterium C7867-007]
MVADLLGVGDVRRKDRRNVLAVRLLHEVNRTDADGIRMASHRALLLDPVDDGGHDVALRPAEDDRVDVPFCDDGLRHVQDVVRAEVLRHFTDRLLQLAARRVNKGLHVAEVFRALVG